MIATMTEPAVPKPSTAPDTVTLRPGRPEDAVACAAICFEAFGAINRRHGFPPEFPQPEPMARMMSFVFSQPWIDAVVAESGGRIVGSNFLWSGSAVAGVGPITVDAAAQGGSIGRRLMERVLELAQERKIPSVRLVQAAFNTTSMTLYTKLGFDVREPLVCMNGTPPRGTIPGITVRKMTAADIDACKDICRRVHGFDRGGELPPTIAQGTATVAIRGGEVIGYASDIGFFGHAVALENSALLALIGAAEAISGPGFLLPSRNGEVFRWCLSKGLRMVQPMTLMSLGLYNEPCGAFIPSILF
jgi:ribosomal protein S18 acetylase RimI-like enzyme